MTDMWCCSSPKHGEHCAFVEYGCILWAHLEIKQQIRLAIANPERNMIGRLGKLTVSIRLLMFQKVSTVFFTSFLKAQ